MTTEKDQMTETKAWTIKNLLEWTTGHFKEFGSDSARLDAEILLAEALGCKRIELYTRFSDIPDGEPLARYREWVKRRARGEPVAYLVGHKEFYSLRFNVNSSVLIPRPETEHLVVETIEIVKQLGRTAVRIVDVGTGSGCVIIALAKHIPAAQLVAADISLDALKVAKENAANNQVERQIEFVQSNVLQEVTGKFDIVVSNPPYVGTDEENTVDDSVRNFEPELALFSGADGTEVISRLISESATKLNADGVLIFETSPLIMDRCLELVAANGGFSEPRVVKDLSGHRRVVVARKKTQ